MIYIVIDRDFLRVIENIAFLQLSCVQLWYRSHARFHPIIRSLFCCTQWMGGCLTGPSGPHAPAVDQASASDYVTATIHLQWTVGRNVTAPRHRLSRALRNIAPRVSKVLMTWLDYKTHCHFLKSFWKGFYEMVSILEKSRCLDS